MPTKPHSLRRTHAFTITDLLVVIVLIAAMLAIQLPADAAARRTARRMQNSTQLRGIHQGLVTFANSNKNNFPGLDSKGNILADGDATTGSSGPGDFVQSRYWLMLDGWFFTPEYAISPSETAVVEEYEAGNDDVSAPVIWNDRTWHYSYAMLGIKGKPGGEPAAEGRGDEWKQTLNSQAIVLSDRNAGKNATDQVQSIHTDAPGDWRGSVLWNDNHVGFEQTQYYETKFGNGQLHRGGDFNEGTDNLFAEDKDPNGQAGKDALMVIGDNNIIHAGN